jgi:hypothetical protein
MGMCRVVLADGSVMHLDADLIDVKEGHLVLEREARSEAVATFAPGAWRYWLWVEMASV